jgi:serine/threonine protein phosphatase PrpC
MPGVLVIAVADGAGSVEFAEIGANVAVGNGVAQVCAGLVQAGEAVDDSRLVHILQEASAAALSAVQAEAASRAVDYRELASTMILAIAHREFIAAAQIGDGATVVADEAGEVFSLTTPPPSEYLNETVFLTSNDALQMVQTRVWRGRASGIATFSDGLQMLCLKWPDHEPHKAFFTPLFNLVRTADEAEAANELTRFLHSERVGKLTDDDVTLVLAALRNHDDDDANG